MLRILTIENTSDNFWFITFTNGAWITARGTAAEAVAEAQGVIAKITADDAARKFALGI